MAEIKAGIHNNWNPTALIITYFQVFPETPGDSRKYPEIPGNINPETPGFFIA